MAHNQMAVQRLIREKQRMEQDPNPHFIALPIQKNIFEWHFVLYNFSTDSPFFGGQFHGKIMIPAEYPLKPPSLFFITPQGRFKVGEKICLSFTNYHPESWSTAWTISSMIIGLISFMHTEEKTVGGVQSHVSQKRHLAQKSIQFNLANSEFREVFQTSFQRLGLNESQLEQQQQQPGQQADQESHEEALIAQPFNQQQRVNRQKRLIALGIVSAFVFGVILIVITNE